MIDRKTVQQILDAADIVEVVSDFVNLRRRGANYVGLCPFHNEKTPSFSVNKARGICKCFSCGKGGGAVNFIMEHEKLSYYEALKYLAAKYHIEVKEKELTEEERKSMTQRESMLAVNDSALKHFEDRLMNTNEGRNVGLAYFRERGITDQSIATFRLGYSLDTRDDLYNHLHKDLGFDPEIIFGVGLCSKSNYGDAGFDRFKGRVMFPVFNVAGKVVAFGGRTLKNEPAKYVNSPESTIYSKSHELYGLFQAKRAIVDSDKCFLVEGYTDVISMHQSGVLNVVASSGTSLTEGQIRLIHRFTNNVTVLYDGDAAGIKASLRGIDLLLAEGLNIKVLLLPDGEDPDSFARSHSATELQDYISANETDFIRFKTRILLAGTENDPIRKSAVISDIVRSISVIPDRITQSVYAQECANALEIDEKLLLSEVNKAVLANRKKEFENRQAQEREAEKERYPVDEVGNDVPQPQVTPKPRITHQPQGNIDMCEREILRLIVRYGMMEFCAKDGEITQDFTVMQYIIAEMKNDGIAFSSPLYSNMVQISEAMLSDFKERLDEEKEELHHRFTADFEKGVDELRNGELTDPEDLKAKENELMERLRESAQTAMRNFRRDFISSRLISHLDSDVRSVAIDLVSDKHRLSKIYTKTGALVHEYDKLSELIPKAINSLKNCIISNRINEIHAEIKSGSAQIDKLLEELQYLNSLKFQFAAALGERVVLPKMK